MKYGTDHPQAAFEVPAAINVSASAGIDFTDCRFENIAYSAVKFENAAQDCDITSCMFNEIGANAVFIHGDFVVPATTKSINVRDCHISRYGRIFNNAIGILLTHAVDCELTNNEILVYDCSSQTFHQHYGKENIVRNNIFAFGGEGQYIVTKKEEHNSLTLTNNILVGDDTVMYNHSVKRDWFVDDSNLYWDCKNGGNVFSGDSTKLFERHNLVIMTARGYYNNALFEDPLFKDAANGDFTLADNSPALNAGFVPFDYDAGTITLF